MLGDWLLFFARFPRLTACVTSLFVHAVVVAACCMPLVWWLTGDQEAQFRFSQGVTSIELAYIPPEDETAPEPVAQIVPLSQPEPILEPLLETKPAPRTRGIETATLDLPSMTASGQTADQQPNVIVALPPLTRVEKINTSQTNEVKRGEQKKKRVGQEATVASVGTEQYVEAGLQTVPPIFPDEMHRKKIGGTVLLELQIAPNGAITRVSIVRSSGYPLFDASAMNAAAQWRGIPARRAGMPVETTALQEVIFKTPR